MAQSFRHSLARLVALTDSLVSERLVRRLGWLCLSAGLSLSLLVAVAVLVIPGWIPHFGQDFGATWVAARMHLEGDPLLPFDFGAFWARQAAAFGSDWNLLWHYPPTWHLFATPLGQLD